MRLNSRYTFTQWPLAEPQAEHEGMESPFFTVTC